MPPNAHSPPETVAVSSRGAGSGGSRGSAIETEFAGTPAQWVAGVLRGDEQAAKAVWHAYAGEVTRLLRRMLGPNQELDDLTQDVFLILFACIHQLRDPNALRSFVTGIAIRVVRKELQRRWKRRWLRLTPEGNCDDVPVADDSADHLEVTRRLYSALDTLDPDLRTYIVLRHIEERELTEIAEWMGTSLATVKRRLVKAEELLAQEIARDQLLSRTVRLDLSGGTL